MNAHVLLPPEVTPAQIRADIAQTLAELLAIQKANRRALRAASGRFNPPVRPSELTVTYRGPFGSLAVDVDGQELREQLADFSPRSRRGKRLRRLLRLHDEHCAQVWADRAASGFAAAWDQSQRLEESVRTVARAVLAQPRDDLAIVALQGAALVAVKLDCYHDIGGARAVVEALLEVAGAEAA